MPPPWKRYFQLWFDMEKKVESTTPERFPSHKAPAKASRSTDSHHNTLSVSSATASSSLVGQVSKKGQMASRSDGAISVNDESTGNLGRERDGDGDVGETIEELLQEVVTVCCVSNDGKCASYFDERSIQLNGSSDRRLSDQISALNFRLRSSNSTYSTEHHVAGDPTLLIVLSGQVKIELRNGDHRIFSQGDMFIAQDYLAEGIQFDDTIHGHRAEVVGGKPISVLHLKLGRAPKTLLSETVDMTANQGLSSENTELTENELRYVHETTKKHRLKVIEQFDEDGSLYKRCRHEAHQLHQPRIFGTRVTKTGENQGTERLVGKRCVICGEDASQECMRCEVPLHIKRKKSAVPGSKSCFVLWHEAEKVKDLELVRATSSKKNVLL